MTDSYVHPEVLVSTDWVAQHLNDPKVRIVETDEDVLLYDIGHVPGAVKIDWHTDLQRSDRARLPRRRTVFSAPAGQGHCRRYDRGVLRRQEQLVGVLCASGCSSCSASKTRAS